MCVQAQDYHRTLAEFGCRSETEESCHPYLALTGALVRGTVTADGDALTLRGLACSERTPNT